MKKMIEKDICNAGKNPKFQTQKRLEINLLIFVGVLVIVIEILFLKS